MAEATLYSMLVSLAAEQPDAAAILAPGQEAICFDELVRRIDASCERLARAGIKRGDRVALLSSRGPEAAVATLAVACCAGCVPLNPAASESEITVTLKQTRAAALVVPEDRGNVATEVAERLGIPTFGLARDAADGSGGGRWHGPEPSGVALLMRTSGSTARPKSVPVTHSQIVARADVTRRLVDLRSSDRCLNLMPLCYMHGLNSGLTGPLLAGGSVICPRSIDERTFFDCLERLRPTWYTAGATHHLNILAWLEHREVEHRLRFVRSGSAPLPRRALDELERRLAVPVVESVSCTEAGTLTSNPASWKRKPGSVGITHDDNCAIADEQGNRLAPGRIGELLVRGPGVVAGYDGDPEMTRAKFRGGWFHTGDLAEFDTDGYLWLRGRLDDVINRGGEKISPEEVDAVLLTHPAVERALTFPVPHPTLHSEIATAVVPRAGLHVTKNDLHRYLSKRLAAAKIPRHVVVTEDLPTTASGKPMRRGAAEYFGVTAETAADSTPLLSRALRRVRERVRRFLRPLSPLERPLLKYFRLVLGRDDVGVADDFFLSGGDSLSAITLIEMIEKKLQITIPLQYLMENGSVERLARRLLQSPPAMPDVVAIQTAGSRRPIFAVGGRWGYVLRLILVGRALGDDQPFYGLQPPGMDWDSVGASTIPQFASHYIERIRAIQPNGPYRLFGASFGGLVVYEMALQLQSAGEEVELLALIDTYPANCLLNGETEPGEMIPLKEERGEFSEARAAPVRVVRAHARARGDYVMQRRFRGELFYFACDERDDDRESDRRHLWTHFATSLRIVPIAGRHGKFHREPQFSALCGSLRDILRTKAECR